jgi:hypothetical protein
MVIQITTIYCIVADATRFCKGFSAESVVDSAEKPLIRAILPPLALLKTRVKRLAEGVFQQNQPFDLAPGDALFHRKARAITLDLGPRRPYGTVGPTPPVVARHFLLQSRGGRSSLEIEAPCGIEVSWTSAAPKSGFSITARRALTRIGRRGP